MYFTLLYSKLAEFSRKDMWECVLGPHLDMAYDGRARQFASISGDQRIIHYPKNICCHLKGDLLVAKVSMKKQLCFLC